MKKKITFLVLFFLVVASAFSINVKAYGSTFSDATDREIGVSTYSYLSAGEINMFHYEVASNGAGAYNIYSTGSTDVKAYMYEKNGIWPFIHYDQIAYNDDGGEGTNFRIERDLDNYEDYFVKVQAYYNNETGSYRLYFEKNLDKEYSSNGGIWDLDSAYNHTYDKYLYYPASAIPLLLLALEEDMNLQMTQAYLEYGWTAASSVLAAGLTIPFSGPLAMPIAVAVGIALQYPYDSVIDSIKNSIITESGRYIEGYVNNLPVYNYSYGVKLLYSRTVMSGVAYSGGGIALPYNYILYDYDVERWTDNYITGVTLKRGDIEIFNDDFVEDYS